MDIDFLTVDEHEHWSHAGSRLRLDTSFNAHSISFTSGNSWDAHSSCSLQLAGRPLPNVRSGGISLSHSLTKWCWWAHLTKYERIWVNDFSAGSLIIHIGMIQCIWKTFLWQGYVSINNLSADANPQRAIIFSFSARLFNPSFHFVTTTGGWLRQISPVIIPSLSLLLILIKRECR